MPAMRAFFVNARFALEQNIDDTLNTKAAHPGRPKN